VRVELTPATLRADLQAMRTVTEPGAGVDTLASFVVEDGRPGATRT
jgi:alkaline phosphatase D